jgi:DNA-3-methyladenine glycosylase
LFAVRGTVYVRMVYGTCLTLDLAAEAIGVGAAVLIRALEPVAALDTMRARRGLHGVEQLCSGPGKLTQALGIELALNGSDVGTGPLRVGPRPPGWEDVGIVAGPRIGITKAVELEWRFCAVGSRSVSRPWPPGLRR